MPTVTRFFLTPPVDPIPKFVLHRYKRNSFFGTSVGITGFFVLVAGAIDGTHVKVIFNVPAVVVEALNPANYTINLGVSVHSVTQETAQSFILTTSPQSPGVTYILTLAGIHDLSGDSI